MRTRSIQTLALTTSLLVLLCGCNGSRQDEADAAGQAAAGSTSFPVTTGLTGTPGGTGTANTSTVPGPAGPAAPATQVGSRFWYVGDAFGNPLKSHSANEATWAQQVLALTNQERAANGLPALQYDSEAELAAKAHCEDMQGRNFFDHYTPEGWSPLDRLVMLNASGFTMSGENIAFGQRSPAEVVTAWMNSPGHRANILLPGFTHMGVGVAEGTPYWAQVFTTR